VKSRSIGNWVTNWDRSTLPVPLRLLVASRDLALRMVRRDICCGHDGEPGC
jgi:hypothetical protein